MSIMLGNLTVEQIEQRLNLTLKEEHKAELKRTWNPNASSIGDGRWHWFDIPLCMVCGDMATAEKWRDIFMTYDLSNTPQFVISWER